MTISRLEVYGAVIIGNRIYEEGEILALVALHYDRPYSEDGLVSKPGRGVVANSGQGWCYAGDTDIDESNICVEAYGKCHTFGGREGLNDALRFIQSIKS
jgi:hypothetical protein